MANQGRALKRFHHADESDVLEQPRQAPLPFSKPQLEVVFPSKGKTASEPLLTLKNLQKERARYKQSRLSLMGESSHVKSVVSLQRDLGAYAPTRPGSMSDRMLMTPSPDIALLTSFFVAPHREELTQPMRNNKRHETSPSVISPVCEVDDEPRCCPVPVLGLHHGKASGTITAATQSSSRRTDSRKQPSQVVGSKADRQPQVCHSTHYSVYLPKDAKPVRGSSASSRAPLFSSPRKPNESLSKNAAEVYGRLSGMLQYKPNDVKRTRPASSRK